MARRPELERFSEQQEISAAFSLLAKDEVAHKAQFKKVLDQLPPEQEGGTAKDETSTYLGAMATSEFFQGDEGLVGKLEKAQGLDMNEVHREMESPEEKEGNES